MILLRMTLQAALVRQIKVIEAAMLAAVLEVPVAAAALVLRAEILAPTLMALVEMALSPQLMVLPLQEAAVAGAVVSLVMVGQVAQAEVARAATLQTGREPQVLSTRAEAEVVVLVARLRAAMALRAAPVS